MAEADMAEAEEYSYEEFWQLSDYFTFTSMLLDNYLSVDTHQESEVTDPGMWSNFSATTSRISMLKDHSQRLSFKKRSKIVRLEQDELLKAFTRAKNSWVQKTFSANAELEEVNIHLQEIEKDTALLQKNITYHPITGLVIPDKFIRFLKKTIKNKNQDLCDYGIKTESKKREIIPLQKAVAYYDKLSSTLQQGDVELIRLRRDSLRDEDAITEEDLYELKRLAGWFGEELFLLSNKVDRKLDKHDKWERKQKVKQIKLNEYHDLQEIEETAVVRAKSTLNKRKMKNANEKQIYVPEFSEYFPLRSMYIDTLAELRKYRKEISLKDLRLCALLPKQIRRYEN